MTMELVGLEIMGFKRDEFIALALGLLAGLGIHLGGGFVGLWTRMVQMLGSLTQAHGVQGLQGKQNIKNGDLEEMDDKELRELDKMRSAIRAGTQKRAEARAINAKLAKGSSSTPELRKRSTSVKKAVPQVTDGRPKVFLNVQKAVRSRNAGQLRRALTGAEEGAGAFDAHGKSALYYVAEMKKGEGMGDQELIELLVELGADVTAPCTAPKAHANSSGMEETVAYVAASQGRDDLLRLLQNSFSVDLNAPGNRLGATPAYAAADAGCVECLTALHEAGVDLSDACNSAGDTPAYVVSDSDEDEHAACLRFLHATAGVDLSGACDAQGHTPLYYMAKFGHARMLEELHALGYPLSGPCVRGGGGGGGGSGSGSGSSGEGSDAGGGDACDGDGGGNGSDSSSGSGHAAYFAVHENNILVLEILHQHGVDLSLRCCGGKGQQERSPKEWALLTNRIECIQFLDRILPTSQ